MGIAAHPQTGELWASVNERDGLGDDLVPDYVTRVREGGDPEPGSRWRETICNRYTAQSVFD